jgi:hypothetical protein
VPSINAVALSNVTQYYHYSKRNEKLNWQKIIPRKIFSTANITLNINKIIVIFYFLVENLIELLWTQWEVQNHLPGFNSRYVSSKFGCVLWIPNYVSYVCVVTENRPNLPLWKIEDCYNDSSGTICLFLCSTVLLCMYRRYNMHNGRVTFHSFIPLAVMTLFLVWNSNV